MWHLNAMHVTWGSSQCSFNEAGNPYYMLAVSHATRPCSVSQHGWDFSHPCELFWFSLYIITELGSWLLDLFWSTVVLFSKGGRSCSREPTCQSFHQQKLQPVPGGQLQPCIQARALLYGEQCVHSPPIRHQPWKHNCQLCRQVRRCGMIRALMLLWFPKINFVLTRVHY